MTNKKTLPMDNREEAEKLAMQPYSVTIIQDITDRGEQIFLAINPELDGCMAHGKTSEEAISNLREARVDYIQVCLLSGISIPAPSMYQTIPSGTVIRITYDNSTYEAKQVYRYVGSAQYEDGISKPQFEFEQLAPC